MENNENSNLINSSAHFGVLQVVRYFFKINYVSNTFSHSFCNRKKLSAITDFKLSNKQELSNAYSMCK